MASWEPAFAVQRRERTLVGRQRRQRAWIALAVAVFSYMAWWGARNLLG